MNTHISVSSAVIVFGDKLRRYSMWEVFSRILGDYASDKQQQIGRFYIRTRYHISSRASAAKIDVRVIWRYLSIARLNRKEEPRMQISIILKMPFDFKRKWSPMYSLKNDRRYGAKRKEKCAAFRWVHHYPVGPFVPILCGNRRSRPQEC